MNKKSTSDLFLNPVIQSNNIKSDKTELSFYSVSPKNIYLMNRQSCEIESENLSKLISSVPSLSIYVCDGETDFKDNIKYLKKRCKEESNPSVRALLQKDLDNMTDKKEDISSSRKFFFAIDGKVKSINKDLFLSSCLGFGFDACECGEEELKNVIKRQLLSTTVPLTDMEYGSEYRQRSFTDYVLPTSFKVLSDKVMYSGTYRSIWAIREYPLETSAVAILRELSSMENVSIKMYFRRADRNESKSVIRNNTRKNIFKMNSNDPSEQSEGKRNMEEIRSALESMQSSREYFIFTSVYIEMKSDTEEGLNSLCAEVSDILSSLSILPDKLWLRQLDGFISSLPYGYNAFSKEFERILPSSSAGNLYPLSYSGKTDPNGIYIGKEKYGSSIILDPDRREGSKTNSNILILGNSGMGKSYLSKFLVCNLMEQGKNVIILDPEEEYSTLTENLGGDNMTIGHKDCVINPLEIFDKDKELSTHISFLRDFFSLACDLSPAQSDILSSILNKLYFVFGFNPQIGISSMTSSSYPVLKDLLDFCVREYRNISDNEEGLYTKETLKSLCMALHALCVSESSPCFSGHTSIKEGRLVRFGAKDINSSGKRTRNAALFNILEYMNSKMLSEGNTVIVLDELYMFLSSKPSVEKIREFVKRGRKKESAVMMSTQNIEDFLLPEFKEFTVPLFTLPSQRFLFSPGNVNPSDYKSLVNISEDEMQLLMKQSRGNCLFKCGDSSFLINVKVPEYKSKLFGYEGGR